VTVNGRFYRLVTRTDEGWNAEEVEQTQIGDPLRVAEIMGLKTRYDQGLAAHDELDQKLREGNDTPEGRALLHARAEELHELRDRLILLCNGRTPEARTVKSDPDRWMKMLVIVLAIGFVASVAYCYRRLAELIPEQMGKVAASTAFFLASAALLVIGARQLAKHKKRLVTANLVGCYTLLVIAVAVAAFAIMFVAAFLHYAGAYNQ